MSLKPPGRGGQQTTRLCGADGRGSNTGFQREVQAALVVAVNLLTVEMASAFPTCVVCSHSALVVFPIVFTKVRLNIIIFTWMTDHTSVLTVFWFCYFYFALFCAAPSLWLCCKVPLLSKLNSPLFSTFSKCNNPLSSPFPYRSTHHALAALQETILWGDMKTV